MAGEELKLTDHIPEILEALHVFMAGAVEAAATQLTTTYQDTAPVATGFMASSAYVVTKGSTTYGSNLAGSPGAGDMLPQVEAPSTDLEAVAAVGASYAAYPEYGTIHMAAQPAFTPAFDSAEQFLSTRLDGAEVAIKSAGVQEG